MFGFHAWDLILVFFFLCIIALIVGIVLWATRRPTKVIVVPMNMQPPYQGPGQPGAQPPYPGPAQQPNQYPGQPPAQYPPQ